MDDDLISRVERALLGALIIDPGLVPRLEYVEPGDFADDLHRAVYTAIWSLRDATAPSAGDRIAAVARAAAPRVSEEYLRELAGSCPDPRHGIAYGLRLVQAALYRQISQSADVLGARAALLGDHQGTPVIETGANSGPQDSDTARHLGLVSAALRSHTAALAPANAPPAEPRQPAAAQEQDTGSVPAAGRSDRTPDQVTTSATDARSPAEPPDRSASGQALREEHVLTALLQQHRDSDQILDFLPAAAFTSPDRQEILRAIRRLSHASQPVDELTVIWELRTRTDSTSQTHGDPDHDHGIRASVMRLASASSAGQSPSQAARELLRQLDRRTAQGRQPPRRAQPGQAPAQISPSPAAGFPATQAPEAGGPQHGREPRR